MTPIFRRLQTERRARKQGRAPLDLGAARAVGRARRGEAARMNDSDVQGHIEELVAEEHRLLGLLEAKTLAPQEQKRLEEVQVQLDRYYDLLRQRRAREEFGQDPSTAHLRPAETVERYLQ